MRSGVCSRLTKTSGTGAMGIRDIFLETDGVFTEKNSTFQKRKTLSWKNRDKCKKTCATLEVPVN